jgi:hypothetical protein
MKELVRLNLERKNTRQCLLVFDNVENLNPGSSGLSTARDTDWTNFLPQSGLYSIVLTITNNDIAKKLASQNFIELRELKPHAAQRMLENYLVAPISSSEQLEAGLLLQELSYLPLAIVQAVAYINTKNITLQKYRSQLDR